MFRGKQIATGREVALKILHPHNVSDETIVARFRREAEACSKLRDPHTVTTYDFDETPDGILYLAMELLRGRSLHQLQKARGAARRPTRVLRILDQVAESLGEAHANGIVHRDMKPENVFIETRGGEDYVKVLDFGIAKVMSDDRQVPALTAVGQTLGTLEFMSPEQLRGQKLDGRSDIYALGMMAYEMLTGELPFQSAQDADRHHQLPHEHEAPAPSKLDDRSRSRSAVDAIILKMVQKDRDDRFADANALREEIARAQRSLDRTPGPLRGLPPGRRHRLRPDRRRRPGVLLPPLTQTPLPNPLPHCRYAGRGDRKVSGRRRRSGASGWPGPRRRGPRASSCRATTR